jgi:hypothetical protein
MGKSSKARKSAVPLEETLVVPVHPELTASTIPIIDTHTHLVSTYAAYRSAYPAGAFEDVYALTRAFYAPRGVSTVIDVWCEAPVLSAWRELADAGHKWGDLDYRFVMGAFNTSLVVGATDNLQLQAYIRKLDSMTIMIIKQLYLHHHLKARSEILLG